MSSNTEKQDGLPEIYLSPTCHRGQGHDTHTSSDTEPNAWEDTDSEAWTPLVSEPTLDSASGVTSVLGLRDEMERESSFDIPLGRTTQEKEIDSGSEGTQNAEALVIQPEAWKDKTVMVGGRGQVPRQRGETPGSDCPPVASITAFVRRLGQPLTLDTETQTAHSSELIFSPGGDQGFIVPRGVHAYYGSGSDTETLEWVDGEGPTLVPVRDAVEGADGVPSPDQAMESSVEGLERNSPAGLSTPDAEVDVSVTTARTLVSKERQEAVRPPAVGQSEDVLMQSSRKDLGSTDGEESEEESRKRIPQEAVPGASGNAEIHLGSLGSQSENTDSVSTVLDMRRGEVQGCERDCATNTATASSALGGEASLTQPKPAFVVGGLISPRGKLRQFQDAVRDRMQNLRASLELGSSSTDEPVDRQHYLSQLPLYPPLIPTNEPEVSLASFVSVESTNPPESSDRVTSPSVLSVSSVASSKRMEWDSGADVGYLGTNTHVTPAASLSTLERIALGSYASVLRTEPEGTTQAKEKQKVSKKGAKSVNTKGGNQGSVGRNSVAEPSVPFPLYSARILQNREKVCWSSSEEDLQNKLSSPAQSPRRRPRRRALMASPRDGDTSARRSSRTMHFLDKRLREITQERHNEGKSSSLVELATSPISSCHYRRSNSQQSLHVAPSQARSTVSTSGKRDTTAAGVTVTLTKTGEQLVANTSASTSTLVQSMSPLPAAGTGASTSTSTATPAAFQQAFQQVPGGNEGHVPVTGDSMSSLTTHDREYPQQQHGKSSWTSSGNDISSRSEGSSSAWHPSHTDTESLTSRTFSAAEPGDLKARKNSENAKNHDNILRKGSGSDLEGRGASADSSSSSPGHVADPQSGAHDAESTLESQVSLQSFNNSLHALSVKLQEHIQALLDNGSLKKVQDYNKLQDYVQFVGVPSVTEEECRLRRGVAGVITRMFGEIAFDHHQVTTDTSNTFTSETSDSHVGDQHLHAPGNCEDLDVPIPWCDSGGEKDEQKRDGREKGKQDSRTKQEEQLCVREEEQQGDGKEQDKVIVELDRSTTPGGTVTVVPYRPPSSSRTYFMAVAHECEAGVVEGEHVLTSNDVSVSRGQAEGERLEWMGTVPLTPRLDPTPSESGSNNECDSAKVVSGDGVTLRKGYEEAHSSLPSNHQFLERSQGTGTPQSESSPGYSSSLLQYTWPREESTSSHWWAEGGRSERLYQDRRGGLHVANQPPGYADDHDDSHPSESLSDHDHHLRRHSGDAGRPSARPWTSSGSESAYETIRERHRHVDEALASSFEFYSTSPRDARLLGYVSSEGQEEEEQQSIESPIPTPSPAGCDPAAHSSMLRHPWHLQKHHYHQQEQEQQQHEEGQQQQQQQINSQNSSPSSHTDNTNNVSSQISFIQHQKQKYVRKIQRHIHTLEKLERALLDQLGDSIGSEGNYRQRVSERCSHTGSDTNCNIRTHDVDRSDTMSSIKSSEESIGAVKKQRNLTHNLVLMGSRSSHLSGQESPLSNDGNGEDIQLASGPSGTGQSFSSSPRINISQLSSDMMSSRASTMRQVEEEVRKLATTEEQSRKVALRPHSSSRCRGSHIQHRRNQHRKESGREEAPVRSEFISQRGRDNTPDSTISDGRMPFTANEVSATRRVPADSSSSELQSAQALTISEKGSSDLPASESQISKQSDDKESKHKNQTGKGGFVTDSSGKALNFRPSSAARVNISELPSVYSSTIQSRDFGQMFPSSECIIVGRRETGESVGVQTSNSLLYSRKGFKKRDDSLSVSTSDKESTAGSLRIKKTCNKLKQAAGSNEDTNNAKKHIGKSSHKRTSDMKKPLSSRKHLQEETPKSDEISKKKELIREKSKNRESKSNSLMQASDDNKKNVDRSSSRGTVKNKLLPLKNIKIMQKSGRKNPAVLEGRPTAFNDKHSESQARELSSRPSSESEDRTISSGSSLPQSVQNISHVSSEHHTMSSDKEESIENEGIRIQHSEGDNPTECLKELEHHSQLDVLSSTNKNCINQGHQSSSGKQCITSDDQSSVEEFVHGLKGGAEDSLIPKAPTQLLISPTKQNGISRQMNRFAGNSHANHKLTNVITPSQTKRENLRNKSNLVQLCFEEERHTVVTIQGSDPQREEQQNKSETLKVAWVQDKEKESVSERKSPVRFEVKFFTQENFNPRKSKFPATSTTTSVMQEELTHSTKVITLQEALARARPDYLREAGDRSALIHLKREMRQAAQAHNHNVLAQIPPNLQTPSTLQRFIYKPDLAPLFSYKDIRQQNQRLYSLLPEARAPGAKQHQAAVIRTNRLLASLYSQRLRRKVVQGQVSHAHKEVVTPLVHRVPHH